MTAPRNALHAVIAAKPNHWLPPPAGLMKINVDASVSRAETFGAVGATCRDETGAFQEPR
jgi:hypothetical protein